MGLNLNEHEIRVLGCLMEKSVTTPDQYPLSLNALTNACNQKSSRDPVMSLEQGEVLRTLRALEEKHLVAQETFKTRVEKYVQRLCNTPFAEYQLEAPEFAVMTLLLLRGPQTPGELRSRSPRLHPFADNGEVSATLEGLMAHDGGALVVKLPRRPGRQDSEYMHLLGDGPIPEHSAPAGAPATLPPAAPASPAAPEPATSPGVEARLRALEAEVAELKRLLGDLTGEG